MVLLASASGVTFTSGLSPPAVSVVGMVVVVLSVVVVLALVLLLSSILTTGGGGLGLRKSRSNIYSG